MNKITALRMDFDGSNMYVYTFHCPFTEGMLLVYTAAGARQRLGIPGGGYIITLSIEPVIYKT